MIHNDTAPVERRNFLRLAATGFVGAAVLACTDSSDAPEAESGTTLPPPETTLAPPQTTTPEAGKVQDATVTRTLRTLELAMVNVYDSMLGLNDDLKLETPVTYTSAVQAILQDLRQIHSTRSERAGELVSAAGAVPANQPNKALLDELYAGQLDVLSTEERVVTFALSLEELMASTYVWGIGTVTTGELRAGLARLGAESARGSAALAVQLEPSGATAAPDGLLDTSGPARAPADMFVLEGADGNDTPATASTGG